jgi:hypothetical protein
MRQDTQVHRSEIPRCNVQILKLPSAEKPVLPSNEVKRIEVKRIKEGVNSDIRLRNHAHTSEFFPYAPISLAIKTARYRTPRIASRIEAERA